MVSLSLPAQFLYRFYKEDITRLFFMMRIYKALGRKNCKSYSCFFTSNNRFCNILESSSKPFPEYLWSRVLNFTLHNSHIIAGQLFLKSFLFRKFLVTFCPSYLLCNGFSLIFFFLVLWNNSESL